MGDAVWQSSLDVIQSQTLSHYRSLDDLPDALTQAKVIDGLKPNPKEPNFYNYNYFVCKKWHNTWQKYLGRAEGKFPGQTAPPGPVTMNTGHLTANRCISGQHWKQIVKWYGVSPQHPLCRISRDQGRKDRFHIFEFGFLNPLLDKIQRQLTNFQLDEFVGYVEFQLRYILKVPKKAKTRLWFCLSEKQCMSQMKPLLDRRKQLTDAVKFNDQETARHVLALEVQGQDCYWPSGLQETPSDNIVSFYDVIEGYSPRRFEKFHLAKSVEDIKDTFSQSLTSVIDSLVSQTSDALSFKLKEIQELRSESQQTAEDLQLQEADLVERERQLEANILELRRKEYHLAAEKLEFQCHKAQMEALNKVIETNVTLNIGGHIHHTSTVTLTSDPDSMLAKMFGGRYPIRTLEDGSYFIDRNGSLFHYILDYLRDRFIDEEALAEDQTTLMAVYREADYYQIAQLTETLYPYIEKFQCVFNFQEDFFSDED